MSKQIQLMTLKCPRNIIKRDGSLMPFDAHKIRQAMASANNCVPSETLTSEELDQITGNVIQMLDYRQDPDVETVQDCVEEALMAFGVYQTAKAYVLYREDHKKRREAAQNLMESYKQLTFVDSADSDLKRENANIDGNTAMGTMLKYGTEGAKSFVDNYILPEDMAKAHQDGSIHIHDKDFYMLTETCCQIDLQKLFKDGFSTGHGFLREPQSILSYASLACIAMQANQNEMHGGQSIPDFDFAMAPGVTKTYRKHVRDLIETSHLFTEENDPLLKRTPELLEIDYNGFSSLLEKIENETATKKEDGQDLSEGESRWRAFLQVINERCERDTYQAMQALIHNLNTMNSRAGAQVPFSSINYGTDTSAAGRLVIKNVLLATIDGLGRGETPIFPVQIFKVKEGISAQKSDPNYDLFQLAIKCSAKRLFPNFSFLDAPFNRQFYRPDNPNTEVAYMGCRTRVISNVYDPRQEVTKGRGNLSFTSINLPRLAIEARGDYNRFFSLLDETMDLVFRQLRHRFDIQRRKKVKNYPFLMGQGNWLESEYLEPDDDIDRVIRHGSLSIGFIGLAECLVALTGKHHGESKDSQALGLKIVGHMRERCNAQAEAEFLNYTLLATPAEGLSGRFIELDKKRYGILPNINEREYYTNSFHVPVYFPIDAKTKIDLEAPYHALTNAGHISYVELDGDPSSNLEAFEKLILHMKDAGIGYGSINHPIDHDPVCGYNGIIKDVCPKCGRKETDGGPPFERIRRITGYLVGSVNRFNNAKKAELEDRLKHHLS